MRKTLISSALVGCTLLVSAPAAMATPSDGCSPGYSAWDIDTEPYMVDNANDFDDDGIVCARKLGVGISKQFGVDFPIYLFRDNDLVPVEVHTGR